jgi:hypothetical protein
MGRDLLFKVGLDEKNGLSLQLNLWGCLTVWWLHWWYRDDKHGWFVGPTFYWNWSFDLGFGGMFFYFWSSNVVCLVHSDSQVYKLPPCKDACMVVYCMFLLCAPPVISWYTSQQLFICTFWTYFYNYLLTVILYSVCMIIFNCGLVLMTLL